MKRFVFVLIGSVFFSLFSFSQEYKVIHVTGEIQAKSSQKILSRGSEFNQKEKFNYKTDNARAVVIDTKAGKRMILKKSSTTGNNQQANLAPSMGNIASRSGALLQRLDVKNHFQGQYVILGELKVKINKQVFPQNDTQFFFISFIYKGVSINKKLNYIDDTLVINKDTLLRVDGKPVKNENITDMSLYYYSKVNGNVSTSLISNNFYPVFPDDATLKSEVDLMLKTLPKDSKIDKQNFIIGYINDAYGKTNNDNVKIWYKKYYSN